MITTSGRLGPDEIEIGAFVSGDRLNGRRSYGYLERVGDHVSLCWLRDGNDVYRLGVLLTHTIERNYFKEPYREMTAWARCDGGMRLVFVPWDLS